MKPLPQAVQERLARERNIWLVTVRPDGRPHLVPVWFTCAEELLYVCIEPESVKGRNLVSNNNVCVSLQDPVHPFIGEGRARVLEKPWPAQVVDLFQKKYAWDIFAERQYTQLLEIRCRKWLWW